MKPFKEKKAVPLCLATPNPITALDLYPIDRPKEVAYFRNGFFLSATGEIHSEGQMSYRCTLNLPASRRD